MNKSIFSYRNFIFHFISQLSEAINDATLRNIIILIATFNFNSQESSLNSLVNLCMILPFILFSKTAGQLSDKYQTKDMAIYIKISEIFIILLFLFGYRLNSLAIMLLSLLFMGTHSAFFSPVKMSLLKKLLPQELISKGSVYIQTSTYISLIIGVILARLFILYPVIISAIMLIIACIALYSSYSIQLNEHQKENITIQYNPLKNLKEAIQNTIQDHSNLKISILGITIALFIIGSISILLPVIIKKYLAGSPTITSLTMIFPVIGIILGALFYKQNTQVSHKYISICLFTLGMIFAAFLNIIHTKEVSDPMNNNFLSVNEFLLNFDNIMILLLMLSAGIITSILILPLYLNIQLLSDKLNIGRNVATQNTFSSTFGTLLSAVYIMTLSLCNIDEKLILIIITSKIFFTSYLFFINVENSVIIPKFFIRAIAGLCLIPFRVSLKGLENLNLSKTKNNIFIANHISYIDGILIVYHFEKKNFIPVISKSFLQKKPFISFLLKSILDEFYTVDESNPMAIKELIKYINNSNMSINILIFPEGRLANQGIIMKMYDGPAKIAIDTNSDIIPIYLDGPEKSIFSRTKSTVTYFPKITIVFKEPIKISSFEYIEDNKEKMYHITQTMYDILCDMNTEIKINNSSTLFQSLIEKYKNSDSKQIIFTDHEKYSLDQGDSIYSILISSIALGQEIMKLHKLVNSKNVGLLMPSNPQTLKLFYAIQYAKLVPAMINFTAGVKTIKESLYITKVKYIYTSRTFIEKAGLDNLISELEIMYQIIYLEDINPVDPNNKNILYRTWIKFKMFFASIAPQQFYYANCPNSPAVILFTSGSENKPKAVNLSHRNIEANIAQINTRIDTNNEDILFHALPIFHSFGLISMILAVKNNIKTLFFPDPKKFVVIPNLIYSSNATILFSTDIFLQKYGEYAHQYDLYSLRYVFAGAEKLEDATRQLYFNKFGIRILEGYGTTEASPIISVCTNMHYKVESVGRFLPLIKYKIVPIEGIKEGGELHIKGPNIMLGYTKIDNPGEIIEEGDSWYNTGDIVSVDPKGFIYIQGRTKRFAKIAGEMISLEICENILKKENTENDIACVLIKDKRNQEMITGVSVIEIDNNAIISICQNEQLSAMHIPKFYCTIKEILKLPTGKINYREITKFAQESYNKAQGIQN